MDHGRFVPGRLDSFRGGFKVPITEPHGFERTVTFALDDEPAVIAQWVRESGRGGAPNFLVNLRLPLCVCPSAWALARIGRRHGRIAVPLCAMKHPNEPKFHPYIPDKQRIFTHHQNMVQNIAIQYLGPAPVYPPGALRMSADQKRFRLF